MNSAEWNAMSQGGKNNCEIRQDAKRQKMMERDRLIFGENTTFDDVERTRGAWYIIMGTPKSVSGAVTKKRAIQGANVSQDTRSLLVPSTL